MIIRATLRSGTAAGLAMIPFALPLAFGDPTPWQLGAMTIFPSLAIHLVYGVVLGLAAPQPLSVFAARAAAGSGDHQQAG